MAIELSCFQKLTGLTGFFCAQKGTLRCTAIRLKDGSLCVYSPVSGLTRAVQESLDNLGEVRYLLAPNHYHNKGLVEYTKNYPDAILLASEDAIPRLSKITGLEFLRVDVLKAQLPSRLLVHTPAGLKTGEVWLRNKQKSGVSWLVADAFCTMKENSNKPVSAIPEILGTFPKMGIENKQFYQEWLLLKIDSEQPRTIVPCHGSLIQSDTLPAKLRKLVRAFT